jgi:hypothetical protein
VPMAYFSNRGVMCFIVLCVFLLKIGRNFNSSGIPLMFVNILCSII